MCKPGATGKRKGQIVMGIGHRVRANVSGLWQVLVTAYRRYGFSGSPLMAAAIAFYSVICLGPLGILLSAALQAMFGEGSNTYQWMQSALQQFGDIAAEQVMNEVDSLLARPNTHVTNALSVAVIIWAGLRLFETLERSLTEIWPGKILRHFLTRKLVSLAMMGFAGVLLTMFVLANAFFARLYSLLQQFPEIDTHAIMKAQPSIMGVLGFLLSLLAFSVLYKYMPVQKVPKRAALAGALCAAVLWQAASPIFTYSISHSTHSNAIYGGLAGVVVFSLWAFLGAQVLLFGAHFAASFSEVFLGDDRSEGHELQTQLPLEVGP
jgi:membrane protein